MTPPNPPVLIEHTDWAALSHAYGSAEDTPAYLVNLLDDDPDTQAEALGMLEMSVLHQGTLYTATAPAALFVAGILDRPETLATHSAYFPWDDRIRTLRAALVEWLGQVAEAAAWDEDSGEAGDGPDENDENNEDAEDAEDDEDDDDDEYDDHEAVAACRAIRADLFAAVAPYLEDADSATREAALGAVVQLFRAPELADRRAAFVDVLSRLAAEDTDRRRRAIAVLTLGAWGADTTGALDDPDPAVRACAALAPTCAGDPRADAVVLDALTDPAAVDSWFPDPLPHQDGRFRYRLMATAIARAAAFEDLLAVALVWAPLASEYGVDSDWGPLLAKAFPDPHTDGTELTGAQYAFLSAIADNDACWGPIANKVKWFRAAGLPHERQGLRELLLRQAPPS